MAKGRPYSEYHRTGDRINPDAGVNIGLQQQANKANYLANTYAAREQAAAEWQVD